MTREYKRTLEKVKVDNNSMLEGKLPPLSTLKTTLHGLETMLREISSILDNWEFLLFTQEYSSSKLNQTKT